MITVKTPQGQSPSRRPWLALALFLLAPLVGEFLLGNLPVTWLGALVTLAPLYGGGAVLIRELVRRTGRGWPSMVLLGLAYAVIEEAFVTQSLFNPDYVGLRLLDFGYIPKLGIGAWWTVFVLGIHTIWSTAVPIALVEGWVGATPAATRPWLGKGGLVVAVLVFGLGCVVTAAVHPPGAVALSPAQAGVSGLIVVGLGFLAFRQRCVDGPETQRHRRATRFPWPVALATLGLGSAFMTLARLHDALPAAVSVEAMVAVLGAAACVLVVLARRAAWSAPHRLAAAGGFLLVYVWYGFVQVPSVGAASAAVNLAGDVTFSAGAIVLLAVLVRRTMRAERHAPAG